MSEDALFDHLIARARAGDHEAAAQLVRRYEPDIRRVVRVRLVTSHLARLFDSMDICQSVLGSFFARLAIGQFELHTPNDLVKLLCQMARNRLRDKARKYRLDKVIGDVPETLPAPAPGPVRVVAGRDLLHEIKRRLQPPERYLAEQRALGRDWAALAVELDNSPEALRKRLKRALTGVLRQLDAGDSGGDW